MATDEWIKLVAVADCIVGRARLIQVQGRNLAVFRLTDPDRFIVTADECPHAGASLSAGEVTGNFVTCSGHAWTFEIDTGLCPGAEGVKLRHYESRVAGGHLWVRLPPAPTEADLVLPE